MTRPFSHHAYHRPTAVHPKAAFASGRLTGHCGIAPTQICGQMDTLKRGVVISVEHVMVKASLLLNVNKDGPR
jgi:hypothetical protein